MAKRPAKPPAPKKSTQGSGTRNIVLAVGIVILALLAYTFSHRDGNKGSSLSGAIPQPSHISSGDRQRVQALHAWLVENGAHMKGLELAYSNKLGGGITVFTTRSFKKGTPILSLPRSLIITPHTVAQDHPEWGDLSSGLSDNPQGEVVILTLWLMVERYKPDSFWAPYIASLPRRHHTPMFFSSEIRSEFAGLAAVEAAENIATWKETYEMLMPGMTQAYPKSFPRDKSSFDHFAWALTCVLSRAFKLRDSQGKGYVTALFPLIDHLNHSPEPSGDVDSDWVKPTSFIARHDLPPYSEVFNTYGPTSNTRALNTYGFFMDENKDDFLPIRLPEKFFAGASKKMLKRLKKDKLPTDARTPFRLLKDPGHPADFIHAIHIYLQGSDAKLTLENEVKGFFIAGKVLRTYLKEHYPHDINKDRTKLATMTDEWVNSANDDDDQTAADRLDLRNIIKLRVSEKEILQANIDTVEDIIATMEHKAKQDNTTGKKPKKKNRTKKKNENKESHAKA